MQEIINKLKGLASDLEAQIAQNDIKAKELALEISLAKDKGLKNSKIEEELVAREKAVGAVEDVVRVANVSKTTLIEANQVKAENLKMKDLLDEKAKQLQSKDVELKQMIALYRSKNESLEAEKVKLVEDRKAMRIQIIEDLKKLK